MCVYCVCVCVLCVFVLVCVYCVCVSVRVCMRVCVRALLAKVQQLNLMAPTPFTPTSWYLHGPAACLMAPEPEASTP